MSLDFRERRNRNNTVVVLKGEFDSASSAGLLERLLPLVRQGRTFHIDMSDVSYVSSAGLRTLLVVYREAQHADASVTLTGVGEEVRFVMSATGFLDFFEAEMPDATQSERSVR
jgi:anti-sigma B factor antagonist